VKSADQKKEFNFFENFVPSFPENASEPYASEPEIKFLVSRKTSATNQNARSPDCPILLFCVRSAYLPSTAATGIIRFSERVNAQDTPAEPTPDLQLEIAHLLLIDVVGYSELLVNEQIELLQELKQIVRSSECFRAAEARDELIRVPTGDGIALVFFHSPEEPVRCALEISRALLDHPSIRLRMGIHSGPINRVTDVNEKTNIAGSGINIAQRVLDCGDAGHILLSAHVADDLCQYRHWQPYLHDLGECEVKYGLRLHLFNLYKDRLGNPQVPEKLRRGRRRPGSAVSVRPVTAPRWPKVVLITALVVSAIAVVISSLIFLNRAPPTTTTRAPAGGALAAIPAKSIAVLPFENLSNEKENAYFADGVQDEILTGLSRVADLKVISRTSVMRYKAGPKRNLREVAADLGVAHVLEGTVQRAGGRVRVNAQLIDARTDSQLWAERYDRDVADVFAIESELAGKIVAQLQAKISPSEQAAIEQKPTADLAAHDLYVRAKTLTATAVWSTPLQEGLSEAVRLLNQAIERDSDFALAYYQLAHAHDVIYFAGLDHTAGRLAMADAAIEAVARLLPNSGEAHLALAKHLYWSYHDYDRARKELSLAQKSLPNEPWAFEILGFIDRRQGRWAESTKNLERAAELDPQNPHVLQQIAFSYYFLRRYADEERALDRAIAVTPKEAALRASRAEVELDWHADARPLLSTVETILAEDSREAKNVAQLWLRGSLCRRDFDSALRALAALPIAGCYQQTIPFPRAWCEGVVGQMRGDKAAAHVAFTSMRTEAAKMVAEQPDYPEGLCVLGIADAALGNKEDAIREGRRAVELLPVTKDAIIGPLLVQNLALIYAWTGEKDLAFEQLSIAAKVPGYLSYGELRLHPYWDPLRDDPRFEKIVASLAPK
jgi:TolB-like protein/class 3 adenylate cyclase/Tfp pilus assembly protein PilF